MQSHRQGLYEVESIVDKKIDNGKVLYKVKWKGYSHHQSTWEKVSHLKLVPELIYDFEQAYARNTTKQGRRAEAKAAEDDHFASVGKQDMMAIAKTDHPQKAKAQVAEQPKQGQISEEEAEEMEAVESGEEMVSQDQLNCPASEPKGKKQPHPLKNKQTLTKKEQKRLKTLRKQQNNTGFRPFTHEEEPSSNGDIQTDHNTSALPIIPTAERAYEEAVIVRMRSIETDPLSTQRQYLVEYSNGTAKIMSTLQLISFNVFYFIDYLERKAHSNKQ